MEDNGKDITVSKALKLVSSFFPQEWPYIKEEDATIREVTGGFVNTLHLLSRSTFAKDEPASVLIRHFGRTKEIEEPPATTTTLSATEQAVIYYEMGKRGWGPKLYGVFPGGRLEEYIDSHVLTAKESTDPSIRRDVARTYAKLHSLDLPFRKDCFEKAVEEVKSNMERKEALALEIEHGTGQAAKRFAEVLRNTDWSHELDWVATLFAKHDCKATLAIGDANYLNILVKNFKDDCRAVLIDYETCTHSHRGIDIGGHFTERMYCWSDDLESNLTGYPAADLDEQRSFCESYLQEMKQLGQQLTTVDTVEHLLLESQIGRLYQILFSVAMSFGSGVPEGLSHMSALLAGLAHMMDTYHSLKQQFMDKYRE